MRAEAGAVGAHVAGVLVALVDHFQVIGGEALAQHGLHGFGGDGQRMGGGAHGCLSCCTPGGGRASGVAAAASALSSCMERGMEKAWAVPKTRIRPQPPESLEFAPASGAEREAM